MITTTVQWDASGPFAPGSVHTATFRVTNQTDDAVLAKVRAQAQGSSDGSTSGDSAMVNIGVSGFKLLPVTMTMPWSPGNYVLYAEVYIDGTIQGGGKQPFGSVAIVAPASAAVSGPAASSSASAGVSGAAASPSATPSQGGGFNFGKLIQEFFKEDATGATIALGVAAFVGYKYLTRD